MSTERSPGDRHWDPAAELAGGSGLLFWALVAIALCVTSSGPLWHRVRGGLSLRAGGWRFVPDFFQDYASARNYYNGLDVYLRGRVLRPVLKLLSAYRNSRCPARGRGLASPCRLSGPRGRELVVAGPVREAGSLADTAGPRFVRPLSAALAPGGRSVAHRGGPG